MSDEQFLWWLKERLVHVYGESPNVDFVQRLFKITDNIAARKHEIEELKHGLERCYDLTYRPMALTRHLNKTLENNT